MRRSVFPLLLFVFLLTACAKEYIPPPKSAATYFQEGESLFDEGLYDDAIASWEKVRDSFYSPELNRLAELKIAETHYLAGQYAEAAAAYEGFLKEHPDDREAARLLFQLGLSYFSQMLSSDRDQTATRNALATFETVLKRFPEKDKGKGKEEEVRFYIQRCLNRLAEHELYVGRFYLRTDHYDAAINRLSGVLETYPNFFRRDKIYFYLGQAYLEKGDQGEAVKVFNRLLKEFPGTEHVIEAQKIMEHHYR